MYARLVAYLRGVLTRSRPERELDEELQFDVVMETQADLQGGLEPGEARRRALIDVGGIEQAREDVRMQRFTVFDGLLRDFRYAVRTLAYRPSFTGVSVLVLSLGIAANVTMFTLVNTVLFRPLTAASPEQLVFLYSNSPRYGIGGITYSDYVSFKKGTAGRIDLLATARESATLRQFGDPVLVNGEAVSANYFSVLGVSPAIGRPFSASTDDAPGGEPVVAISDRLWRTRFHADPRIIGKTLELDRRLVVGQFHFGRPYTVLAVMKPEFKGAAGPLGASDYWVLFAQRALDYANTGRLRILHISIASGP